MYGAATAALRVALAGIVFVVPLATAQQVPPPPVYTPPPAPEYAQPAPQPPEYTPPEYAPAPPLPPASTVPDYGTPAAPSPTYTVPGQAMDPYQSAIAPAAPRTSIRQVFAGTLATVATATGATLAMGLTQMITGGLMNWFNRRTSPAPAAVPLQPPAVAPAPGYAPATTDPSQMPPAYQPPAAAQDPAQPTFTYQPPAASPAASYPAPAYAAAATATPQFFDPRTGATTAADPGFFAPQPGGSTTDPGVYAGIAYEVHAITARDHADAVSILVRFVDGSTGAIVYSSLGDASVPKEYIEVFAAGRVVQLDDYCRLTVTRSGKQKTSKSAQDKGQQGLVTAFLTATRGKGEAPIPLRELAAVTEATFAIEESLRVGAPVAIPAPFS